MSSKYKDQAFNTHSHNALAWDCQALLQQDWSRPVSSELVEAAKKGRYQVK